MIFQNHFACERGSVVVGKLRINVSPFNQKYSLCIGFVRVNNLSAFERSTVNVS